MNPPAAKASDPSVDQPLSASLRRYGEILRKRLWILLAVVVVGVTAAVLYTMRLPKVYEAVATVVVNPTAPNVYGNKTDVIELGTGSYWSNQEYYNTQIAILTGFQLARATVLEKQDGITTFADRLAPRDKYPDLTEDKRIDAAADKFITMLTATQQRESRIVAIRVRDVDTELAKALANTHVGSYMAYMRGKRTVGTGHSSQLLSVQLDEAEKKLRASEAALAKFKDTNGLISKSFDDKQNTVVGELQRFTEALADARIKRIELASVRKRAQSLESEDVLESPVFALASNAGTVDALKAEYVRAKQQFVDVDAVYGPKSDNYRAAKSKVDDLYAQIKAEAKRAEREIEERYQAAVNAESSDQALVEEKKKEAEELDKLYSGYSPLARDQKQAEEEYTRITGLLQASKQEGENDMINVELHELARSAELVYPRVKVNIVVAFMLSLMLGMSLAFLLDYLDRTIKSAEDVERTVGAPLLGIIPIVADAPVGDTAAAQASRDLYVFHNPTSQAAECCRSIRTNILFSAADKPMKIITVSSPRPREGKTTTTIYMGTIMAQSGQRVLLIDTDLRRPRLHKSLGVSKNRGLTNLVLGDADYDDVIKSTDIPNLFVLPCGPQPPNPAELLLTNRFKQVLAELEKRFDRILLDSPPVLAVTDAVVLARISNGVMLIAQAGKTLLDDVAMSARQFRDVDAPILGVILNDLDISDRRYGGYYYAYGGYGETTPAKSEAS